MKNNSLHVARRIASALAIGASVATCAGLAWADEPAVSAVPAAPDAVANADQIEVLPPESMPTSPSPAASGFFAGRRVDSELRNYTDYLHTAGAGVRHAWVEGA